MEDEKREIDFLHFLPILGQILVIFYSSIMCLGHSTLKNGKNLANNEENQFLVSRPPFFADKR